MNYYLIRFRYERYCQGYEWTTETVLVRESSYIRARAVLTAKYFNATDFENLTFENGRAAE